MFRRQLRCQQLVLQGKPQLLRGSQDNAGAVTKPNAMPSTFMSNDPGNTKPAVVWKLSSALLLSSEVDRGTYRVRTVMMPCLAQQGFPDALVIVHTNVGDAGFFSHSKRAVKR